MVCMQLQVRGPLTALRTLGSILVPRLRQKEGQEIDRDVAQGILTQACASHNTAAHMITFSQISVQKFDCAAFTNSKYSHTGHTICKHKFSLNTW